MAKANISGVGIKSSMEQAVNTIRINCCILKHLGVKSIEKYEK